MRKTKGGAVAPVRRSHRQRRQNLQPTSSASNPIDITEDAEEVKKDQSSVKDASVDPVDFSSVAAVGNTAVNESQSGVA